MTIKSLYPNVRPTLNLNFARTKALDPRVTFTRASTATFVGSNGLIQTAASGAARFDHNPATGESLGLLVEEARTNLATYSEQFDNAAWHNQFSTITANATTAPDGTITADKLASSTGTWLTFIHFPTLGGGGTRTLSVFAKASDSSWLALGGIGSGGELAYFNLSTGVIATIQGNVTNATIVQLSNGWYRCSVTCNFQSYGGFIPVSGDNTLNIAPIGQGIFLWGAQVEAGTFPTSYIPTSGSTVTRAADVASMTGTNFSSWYNQSSGSFLFAHKSPNTPSTSTYFYLITAGIGSTVNGYRITSLVIPADAAGNNAWSTTGAWLTTGLAANESTKLAFGFTNGSAAAVKNGVVQETNTENLAAVVPTTLSLASGVTSTISRLAYYPVRLPDAQLQALTS